jgi:hypothetical protein
MRGLWLADRRRALSVPCVPVSISRYGPRSPVDGGTCGAKSPRYEHQKLVPWLAQKTTRDSEASAKIRPSFFKLWSSSRPRTAAQSRCSKRHAALKCAKRRIPTVRRRVDAAD